MSNIDFRFVDKSENEFGGGEGDCFIIFQYQVREKINKVYLNLIFVNIVIDLLTHSAAT